MNFKTIWLNKIFSVKHNSEISNMLMVKFHIQVQVINLTEWFIFFDGKLNFQQTSICIFSSILSTMSKWLPFWFLANSFKALFYYYYCVNYCLKHTVYNTTLHVSEAAPTGSGSVVSLCFRVLQLYPPIRSESQNGVKSVVDQSLSRIGKKLSV